MHLELGLVPVEVLGLFLCTDVQDWLVRIYTSAATPRPVSAVVTFRDWVLSEEERKVLYVLVYSLHC